MANDLGHNPMTIDTASGTVLREHPLFIKKIVWDEPTTAGHQLSVTDKNSNPIWHKYAIAGGNGIDYEIELNAWYRGLIVPTLGSGIVYIHIN